MNTEQNRPPWDSNPGLIVAHCLNLTPEEVEAKLVETAGCTPSPEDHAWWDRYDILIDAVPLSIATGLPSDPKKHQQPHDIARLIREVLPTHSDQSDDENEIVVNRGLYHLFTGRAKTLVATLPHTDAWEQIQWMATELNHFYGSNNRVIRESRLQEAVRLIDWFRGTDGLHDRESGVVDVDTAAMREFREGMK